MLVVLVALGVKVSCFSERRHGRILKIESLEDYHAVKSLCRPL